MLLMIKINLLPPELRKPERTPLPRRLAYFVGTAVVAGSVVLCAFIWTWIKQVEDQIADLQVVKAAAVEATKDYDSVKQEYERYVARKLAVDEIRAKRKFRWSKRLDILADVIDAVPRMWISTVKFGDGMPSGLNPRETQGRTVEYYMEMRDTRTASADKELYREVERVITDKFIASAEFARLVPPVQFELETQDKYVEGYSHRFGLLLLGLGTVKVAPAAGGPPGGGT